MDFFGSFFHWYANRQKKLYTNLGGVLTIFSFVICGSILTFLFRDCLGRTNIKATENDEINTEFKKIKFGEEKIYIPWAIADYQSRKVNFSGWIYPVIYYYYGERNKETNLLSYQTKILNYISCNETNLKNIKYIKDKNVNLDEMFCIDMEDIIMGGDWFYDFVYNVKIDFFLCEDGVNFGTKGKKCTDYDELTENIGNGNALHVEIHYPQILFKPENKQNPLQIFYNSHFYNFNKINTKEEKLYLKEFSLVDDKGWIFDDVNNSKLWGYDKMDSDSFTRIFDEKNFLTNFTSSKIYSLTIYISRNTKVFTRKYTKLLDALGNTISIVNGIFICFKIFSQFFTEASQDRDILETLFIQKNSMEEKYSKFNKDNNKQIILLNKQSNIDNYIKRNILDKNNEISNTKNANSVNHLIKNSIVDSNSEINLQPKQNKLKLISKFKLSQKKAINISKKSYKFNQRAKFSLNNSVNSNHKVDLQRQKLSNFKSNFGFKKKHLDQIRAYIEKRSEKGKNAKVIDLKNFSFPYYLYLLNIFNKIFAMNDMCCVNRKFTDAWKHLINVFDIVNYIQMQSNIDLVNKIIFEMKSEENDMSNSFIIKPRVHKSAFNCRIGLSGSK